MLSEIARTISEALGFRGVAFNLYRPAWDDFIVSTVHGSDAMCDTLLGETYDWSVWSLPLEDRFERRGAYFIPEGCIDWSDPGSARATCPTSRRGPTTPGSPATSCSCPAGTPTGTCSASCRSASRCRACAPPTTSSTCWWPWSRHRPCPAGRAGGRRGRAPPDRARAAAAGLLAPVRAPLDRRGAPGGVRRASPARWTSRGHDRARGPRDRGADAARRRRLGRRLARPAVARLGRRDPAAARPRLRGRGLLPRAADGGHRAGAAAHRLHLDHERARPARVGPPLARGPALRPGRSDRSGASGPTTRPTGCCPRPRACRPCVCSPTRR